MRISLAVALAAVLVLASHAGADTILSFASIPGAGFDLLGSGSLGFGAADDITDHISSAAAFQVILTGGLTIDPTSRQTPYGASGPVTYNVTSASVGFNVYDPNSGVPGLYCCQGTLQTNPTITIFGGVTSIIDGNPAQANLTITNTRYDALVLMGTAVQALETAGQGSVTITVPFNLDLYLSGGLQLSDGSMAGAVNRVVPTPEPATMALTGLGLVALFARRRK